MGKLKASAGSIEVTPPVGVWLSGYAARVFASTGVHDPLMANAVLLSDGETKLAIVSCDLVGFDPKVVADMRNRIAAKSSIPAANVCICCTHTHSGPASQPFRGVLGYVDQQWLAETQSKIVELVIGLEPNLEPAVIASGSKIVPGIGFNRQDQTHPVDQELGAVAIESVDGRAIATLMNYATHAVVLGPSNLLISGDHPGAAVREIERQRGGVGIFLQGACGDVNPKGQIVDVNDKGDFDDVEAIGSRLASEAILALDGQPRMEDVSIQIASEIIDIPLDPPLSLDELDRLVASFTADRKAAVDQEPPNKIGELIADAMLTWADELRTAIDANTVPKTLKAEVFVVAINNLRLVATPFEAFTDIALRIKETLSQGRTLFVGYANGLLGYVPARWAKDQGGYGPSDAARWFHSLITPIGYDADDILVDEAVSIAQRL